MATKILAVQLETNCANIDGVAWYAYCDGDLRVSDYASEASYRDAVKKLAEADGSPLSLSFNENIEPVETFETFEPVEVPNPLSKATGLRRYWVAYAV